ncbi:phosphogluconate dehydratase [Sessilibacter sp. MAH1]
MLHELVSEVTERLKERSVRTRTIYLDRIEKSAGEGPSRKRLSCGNLAHGFAACNPSDKDGLTGEQKPNVGIVTAYNDMLSAHQPYEDMPKLIRQAVRDAGGVAQVAGGVPAMCDGVTQGQSGMELSLFSRDVIAMSTAVALSHDMFDAVLCLGICDKIVPGLLMGALSFGHLPCIFVPSGPMTTGASNDEKHQVRQLYAEGKVGREELLKMESKSYHGPGTCTFYGTANSNQMLVEIMGLHLPGSSFVNPNTPLREALTIAAAQQVLKLTALGDDYRPIGKVIDERAIINGVVGLLATGGSTNHTMHLVAIAKAAGIQLQWDDFSELSKVIPLLARVYPNGSADINHFQAAGGMGYLMASLMDAGLLHTDILSVAETPGLQSYRTEPFLVGDKVEWRPAPEVSLDSDVLRPASEPFSEDGGLKLLTGNIGRAIIKTSAVKPEHWVIEAPAIVFDDQNELEAAFRTGALDKDFVAVIRFQGPRANGMPELHKLTPVLSSLQSRGFKVALVTDGRMSGASGKVPAAIQVTPECVAGGLLSKVHNGDVIRLDAKNCTLELLVDETVLANRITVMPDLSARQSGTGRELFGLFRANATDADQGASVLQLSEY